MTDRKLIEIFKQIEQMRVYFRKCEKENASITKDSVDGEQRENAVVASDSTRRTDYRNVVDGVHVQECLSDMVEHERGKGRGKRG